MNSSTFRVIAVNILALALVTVGLFYGIIQPYFVNDASYLSYVIAFFMLINVVLSVWDSIKPMSWKVDDFIAFNADKLPFIGILASVVGLTGVVAAMILAIDSGGGGAADLVVHAMHAAAAGIRTAFGPTAVGLVAYLWSASLLYLKELGE